MLKRVYLEITNVCNLSCSFCPGTKRPKRFLSPEEFHTLASRLAGHTEYLYLHVMGEPLLHPRLAEILDIAAELGFGSIRNFNRVFRLEMGMSPRAWRNAGGTK